MRKARPWWAIPGLFYYEMFVDDHWHFIGRRWWCAFTVDIVYRLGFIRAGEAEAIRWSNFTWDFAQVHAERWQEAYDAGRRAGHLEGVLAHGQAIEDHLMEQRRQRELENQDGG